MSTGPSSLDLLVKNGVLKEDPSVDLYGKPSEYLRGIKATAAQAIQNEIRLPAPIRPTMRTKDFLATYQTSISNFPGVQKCYQFGGYSQNAPLNNYVVPEKKASIKDLFTKTNDILSDKTATNSSDSSHKSGWKKWLLAGIALAGTVFLFVKTKKIVGKCFNGFKNIFGFPKRLWKKMTK